MADDAPAPGGAPPPAPSVGGGFDFGKFVKDVGFPGQVILGSAAGVLVGLFLPWANLFFTSMSGFNTGEGSLSTLLAVGSAVAVYLIGTKKAGPNEKVMCLGILGGGGLIAAMALLFILRLHRFMSVGPIVTLVAGGGVAAGGFLLAKSKGHLK